MGVIPNVRIIDTYPLGEDTLPRDYEEFKKMLEWAEDFIEGSEFGDWQRAALNAIDSYDYVSHTHLAAMWYVFVTATREGLMYEFEYETGWIDEIRERRNERLKEK